MDEIEYTRGPIEGHPSGLTDCQYEALVWLWRKTVMERMLHSLYWKYGGSRFISKHLYSRHEKRIDPD